MNKWMGRTRFEFVLSATSAKCKIIIFYLHFNQTNELEFVLLVSWFDHSSTLNCPQLIGLANQLRSHKMLIKRKMDFFHLENNMSERFNSSDSRLSSELHPQQHKYSHLSSPLFWTEFVPNACVKSLAWICIEIITSMVIWNHKYWRRVIVFVLRKGNKMKTETKYRNDKKMCIWMWLAGRCDD